MSKIVTYDDLRENPAMLTNPELVIRIGHKYYNWLTAAPIIMSQIVFQKSLPVVSRVSKDFNKIRGYVFTGDTN